jgi:hypothetical protein
MDSSLIDPGAPPEAVATSFAKQELINASVMVEKRLCEFCAFAPLRETTPLRQYRPVSRKGAKAQNSQRFFSRLRSFCPVAETMIQ